MPKSKDQKRQEAAIRKIRSDFSTHKQTMLDHQRGGIDYNFVARHQGKLAADDAADRARKKFSERCELIGVDPEKHLPNYTLVTLQGSAWNK